MLENFLCSVGIILYIGIFLNFLRKTLKSWGVKLILFDFLFVICSIFVVLSPNPAELEPSGGIVVEYVRGSYQKANLDRVVQSPSFLQAKLDSLEIPAGSAVPTRSGQVLGIVESDVLATVIEVKRPKQPGKQPGECRPRVLRYRINEDKGLKRAAEKACENRKVRDDINAMEEKIRQGYMNPGIDSKYIGEGIIEFRGRNGGRILAREAENGVVEILGKSGKRPKDQRYVINRVKKVFPKNKNKYKK